MIERVDRFEEILKVLNEGSFSDYEFDSVEESFSFIEYASSTNSLNMEFFTRLYVSNNSSIQELSNEPHTVENKAPLSYRKRSLNTELIVRLCDVPRFEKISEMFDDWRAKNETWQEIKPIHQTLFKLSELAKAYACKLGIDITQERWINLLSIKTKYTGFRSDYRDDIRSATQGNIFVPFGALSELEDFEKLEWRFVHNTSALRSKGQIMEDEEITFSGLQDTLFSISELKRALFKIESNEVLATRYIPILLDAGKTLGQSTGFIHGSILNSPHKAAAAKVSKYSEAFEAYLKLKKIRTLEELKNHSFHQDTLYDIGLEHDFIQINPLLNKNEQRSARKNKLFKAFIGAIRRCKKRRLKED